MTSVLKFNVLQYSIILETMLNTLHTEDTQKRVYKISLISIVVLKYIEEMC